jgi:hypothetical protein
MPECPKPKPKPTPEAVAKPAPAVPRGRSQLFAQPCNVCGKQVTHQVCTVCQVGYHKVCEHTCGMPPPPKPPAASPPVAKPKPKALPSPLLAQDCDTCRWLQREHAIFSLATYQHQQIELVDLFADVEAFQREFPGEPYYVCLCGNNRIGTLFWIVRTGRGTGGVLAIVQLRQLGASAQVA